MDQSDMSVHDTFKSLRLDLALPVELLPGILNELAVDPSRECRRALYQCCLVSKSFHSIACRLLFRHPAFFGDKPTQPRVQQLLNVLKERHKFAQSVRSLPLGQWTTAMRDESLVDRRRISQLAIDFLDICLAIQELDFPWVTMAHSHEALIKMKRLKLERLVLGKGISSQDHWMVNIDADIRNEFGSAIWTMDQLVDLVSHLPRLKSLEVRARLRSSRNGSSHLSGQLEDFTFDLLRHTTVSWQYVQRFLSATIEARSLRKLTIAEHQLEDGLESILEAVGFNLTELHTSTRNPVAPTSVPRLASIYCPNLRALTVGSRLHSLSLAFYSLARLRYLETLALLEVPYTSAVSQRQSRDMSDSIGLVRPESMPFGSIARNEALDAWTVEGVLDSVGRMPSLRSLTLGPSFAQHDKFVWNHQEVEIFENALRRRGIRGSVRDKPSSTVKPIARTGTASVRIFE